MAQITLTRKQVFDLVQLVNHFAETEHFTIKSDSSSGIGPTITVQCTLFEKSTTVDITDVESW
jgi:hypothetical protein